MSTPTSNTPGPSSNAIRIRHGLAAVVARYIRELAQHPVTA